MKKITNWMKDHIVLVWAIISLLFALIIHCLFSETAPNEWIAAKWGAGDILTYASTVALGLLAVWQNQKFKEDNDTLQTRMENLTNRANELSVVSKIIEYESERISLLKAKKQGLIDACKTEGIFDDLSDVANQPIDFKQTYVKLKMDSREKQIRLSTIELLTELTVYSDNIEKTKKLIDLTSQYSECSIAVVKDMRVNSVNDENHKKKKDSESEFIRTMFEFISEREILLNKIIYENLSIEQIKALYNKKESNNEQNNNCVA